ncbi:hypothetical protein [Bradyrhizobium sp.]|uniref:hypothetical protein n=1 Tax=Bradyrhizobium sp. TaxID=376 RepID=UPI003C686D89
MTSSSGMWTTAMSALIIPAAVGIVASVAANFLYPFILSVIETRRVAFRESRRKSAEELHDVIVTLRDGTRDKVEYFTRWNGALVCFLVCSFCAFCGAVIVFGLAPELSFSLPPRPDFFRPNLVMGFLLGMASGIFVVTIRIGNRLRAVRFALLNFERYLSDYNAKWGGGKSLG